MSSKWGGLRSAWPLILLILGLACVGLALVESARSVRSNILVARRAVRGYSLFAGWSYREHLTETLRTMAIEALGAVNHGDALHTGPRIPDASDLAHYLPWDPSCSCHVSRKGPLPDAFLGFTLGSDTLAMSPGYERGSGTGIVMNEPLHDAMIRPMPQLRAAERHALVDTLSRMARGGRPAQGFAVLLLRAGDSTRLVMSTAMPTSSGDTAVYATLYTRGVIDSILAAVLDAPGLLPDGLAVLGPNRSLVSLEVQDALSRPLFSSGLPAEWIVPASAQLPSSFGALRVRLQIRPDLAKKLVIGGLPRSRLPLLLSLLLLATGLTVIATLQLRRESRFAQERSAFVASVSHELRTPLTQIRLVTDTLRLGREPDPERQAAALALVDREVTRLQQLVDTVLRFSRIGASGAVEGRRMIDVTAETRRVVAEFAPLATPRGVQVAVDVPAGLSAALQQGALRQLLLNLLDNAVKYGPDGQSITVSVEAMPGGGVRLRVQDEGPGVPGEERERIWRPYVRGSAAAQRAIGGSGIGLTIVQEIARQHGGSARLAESAHGAMFVVELAGEVA